MEITDQTSAPPNTSERVGLLSRIVFENHALRFSAELLGCFVLYSFLLPLCLALGVPDPWTGLSAWLVSCLAVALVDHLYLMPPHFILREAISLSSRGMTKEALLLLDGLYLQSKIPLPELLYRTTRASFLTAGELYAEAGDELELALHTGLPRDRYLSWKGELASLEGDHRKANEIIQFGSKELGTSPLLTLERALILFRERRDLREARRAFEDVLKLPNAEHRSGIPTHGLSKGFIAVCRLWTGYAEEAIDELTVACDRLTAFYAGDERARSTLALLHLERALYCVTHKEREAGQKSFHAACLLAADKQLQGLSSRVGEILQEQ